MGKHSPARYQTYFKAHHNHLNRLKREGFVLKESLELQAIAGTPFLEMRGEVFCQGNLKMTVLKTLRVHKRLGVRDGCKKAKTPDACKAEALPEVLRYYLSTAAWHSYVH